MRKSVVLFTLVCIFIVQLASAQQAITVQKSGAGAPIIFLPGFTTPGSVWDETIRHLDGTYESHTVSYAGFNGLAPIDFPWYDAVKQALIAYIQQEQLTQVTLIGHSMGGNLAVEVASALPDRISGLILLESLSCMRELMMPGVPASSLQYESPYNNQLLAMSDDDFKNMAAMMSQNMANDASKVELITGWTVAADRKTYVYGYTDLLKLDLRDQLSHINIPTLVIGSSFPDKNAVASNLEKQYINLKQKEILIADDSKHFILFDQPEWMYTQINQYLQHNVR